MYRYDGLDESGVARLTGAPRAILQQRVPTVMDLAHRLGEEGASTGTIVLADEQTAGRGRAGRAWISPPGAGIWLAMLMRPVSAPEGGTLAIRIGLAVRDALAVVSATLRPDLKWPNDIVVGGRKLGGILCEARWVGERIGWIAAGIGLNVHGPIAAELRDSAIAAADVDPGVSRLALLEAMVLRVAAAGRLIGPLSDAERERYLGALWMPPDTAPVVGLDADGALLVRGSDGGVVRRTEAA
ncbi:MAG TPA: biotin--[acetyl-CoA-carboxylase] ligase [Gemmatimonadales bacterium]